jgi:hypothetical protein
MSEVAAARGEYRYLLNGERAAVSETWRLRGSLGSECQVASERQAQGVAIEVEAHLSAARVTWFEAAWREEGAAVIHALYVLRGNALMVSRRQGDDVLEEEEIPVPQVESPPLLFPLMRIFTGPLIAGLLQRGGRGTVVLPYIADPAAAGRLLQPQVSQRQARVLERQVLRLPDGSEAQARCCEYSGDQYGIDSRFWLGEDNLLLRYQWRQDAARSWDVWQVAGDSDQATSC